MLRMKEQLNSIVSDIRRNCPLIHHLTNTVTINDCANVALALGASPVMADDPGEAADMARFSKAVILNIGTPHPAQLQAMVLAGKAANRASIPVVLDPVGAGATPMRQDAIRQITSEVQVNILRGNMAEICAVGGLSAAIRGVDSTADETTAAEIAQSVAAQMKCVVALTGKIDAISDGKQVFRIANGHLLLQRVTGTGCMTTTLTGCCAAVTSDYLVAATAGVALMGIAGDLAAANMKPGEGTSTFRTRLIDTLSHFENAEWISYLKLSHES